jgi:glycosyltransferase involved in cell wall biosynthesis
MKIAFIFTEFNFGGIQRVITLLANRFALENNNSVEIILLEKAGVLASNLSSKVKVVELGYVGRTSFFMPKIFLPSSPLVRYLKLSEFDLVMSFATGPNLVLCWLKLLYRFQFTLILSIHGVFSLLTENRPYILRYLKLISERTLFKQGDACVCVSKGLAKMMEKLDIMPKKRIHVIYNPVISPELLLQLDLPVVHPWFKKNNSPLLISAGRLDKFKGFDHLIRSFYLLRKEYTVDAHLMILGDGPEKFFLESLINDLHIEGNVELLGFVTNPLAYIAKADAFVLASQYEGFGNVIVEAIACGVNVVCTDCRYGPREILEDGKWGRLVPLGDINALTKAIYDTLLHPLPIDFLKTRSNDFTVERVFDTYNDLFKRFYVPRHIVEN